MNPKPFYNKTINKKELKSIIHLIIHSYGSMKARKLVDIFKRSGFSFATQAGISISIEDLKVPSVKYSLFKNNNTDIKLTYLYEKRGSVNEVERFQKVIDTWHSTSELLKTQLVEFFNAIDPLNPVYMMAFSGARGNISQVGQLIGMRGLMSDPKGQIIELPIKANFREGLTVTDYVISSYGARKGIVDTALRTADSGYLTRRLVDVAQHVVIRELDCGTKKGIRLIFKPKLKRLDRYIGRVLIKPVLNNLKNENFLNAGDALTSEQINSKGFSNNVIVRSPLICEASKSICQKCYGWDLSQGELVELGGVIGIIAAQSIGEPGTQLTMRTFHTGGVFKGKSRNQIRSQNLGQILFKTDLKSVLIRTSYGQMALKAKNNSYIYILTNEKKIIKIPILIDMLIFVQNKSIVKPNDLIIEIPKSNRQIIKQLKNVRSSVSGEIQVQNLRYNKKRGSIDNGLIWIASGLVYDISPNIRIKKPNAVIASNNAITQTKVTLSLSGIAKISNSKSNFRFFSNLFTLLPNSVFKENESVFIYLKKRMSTMLDFRLDENHYNLANFGQITTKIYSFDKFSQLFYFDKELTSGNLIDKFHICLVKPIEDREECFFISQRIVFPGEIIKIGLDRCNFCHSIYTSSLSQFEITNAINQNDPDCYTWLKKFTIKCKPVLQFAISNPSFYLLKRTFYFLNKINFKFFTKLNFEKNEKLISEVSFIKIILDYPIKKNKFLKFTCKSIKSKKSKWAKLTFLSAYQISVTGNNMSKDNTRISSFISNNQYVEAYSTIATINNYVTKKTKIKELKNVNNVLKKRLLISTLLNYTSYKNTGKNSNFIVVGDPIGNNQYSDYSGYVVPNLKSNKTVLRISKPYYISTGTVLFVNHGQLIKQNEILCQLTAIRPLNDDIVSGLPRIEKLFEARLRNKPNLLIKSPGIVKFKDDDDEDFTLILVIEKLKRQQYRSRTSLSLPIKKGELVRVGQPIEVEDSLNPHLILYTYFNYFCGFYSLQTAALRSFTGIQTLLVGLIQGVYRSQGVYIADKHVEIIVKQMTSKVKIADSSLLMFTIPREYFDFASICYMNTALIHAGKTEMEYEPVILGITKISLMTESFISAASFRETTRMLIKAAIEGRVDWLRGLKENVVLGRLIPAGTGFKSFQNSSFLNVNLKTDT